MITESRIYTRPDATEFSYLNAKEPAIESNITVSRQIAINQQTSFYAQDYLPQIRCWQIREPERHITFSHNTIGSSE